MTVENCWIRFADAKRIHGSISYNSFFNDKKFVVIWLYNFFHSENVLISKFRTLTAYKELTKFTLKKNGNDFNVDQNEHASEVLRHLIFYRTVVYVAMHSNTFIRQTNMFICLWHQMNIFLMSWLRFEFFFKKWRKGSNQLTIWARKKVQNHAYLAKWQLLFAPTVSSFAKQQFNRYGWAILCDQYPEFGYLCEYFSNDGVARTRYTANISNVFLPLQKCAVSIWAEVSVVAAIKIGRLIFHGIDSMSCLNISFLQWLM